MIGSIAVWKPGKALQEENGKLPDQLVLCLVTDGREIDLPPELAVKKDRKESQAEFKNVEF